MSFWTLGALYLGLVFAAPLAGAITPKWAAFDATRLPIPENFQEEVLLDQYSNTWARRTETLGYAESQVLPFYEFRVPADKVNQVSRQEEELPKSFQPWVSEKGQSYIRFLVPDLFYVGVIDKMIEAFGEPVKVWAGAKIQGKATFHVWDPADSRAEPFRLKIERDVKPGQRINNFGLLRSSVFMGVTIRDLEQKKPSPQAVFYREPFAAEVSLPGGMTYSYLVRAIPQEVIHRNLADTAFVPLHGFLNSPLIAQMAVRRKMTVREWLHEEYFPKLARVVAHYNFELGLFFEGHTQNISLLLDRKTGRILKFYLKDASDTIVSPLIQALSGNLPDYKFRPASRLNEDWIAGSHVPAEVKFAGYFNWTYVNQSVVDMTGSPIEKRWNTAEFLANYAEAAGLEPDELSASALEALHLLHNGQSVPLTAAWSGATTALGAKVGDFDAAFIQITQEIADLVIRKRFKKWFSKLESRSNKSLTELRSMAARSEKLGQLNWAMPHSKRRYFELRGTSKLGYLQVNNGVMIFDRDQNEPLGVAYGTGAFDLGLTPEEMDCLLSLTAPRP